MGPILETVPLSTVGTSSAVAAVAAAAPPAPAAAALVAANSNSTGRGNDSNQISPPGSSACCISRRPRPRGPRNTATSRSGRAARNARSPSKAQRPDRQAPPSSTQCRAVSTMSPMGSSPAAHATRTAVPMHLPKCMSRLTTHLAACAPRGHSESRSAGGWCASGMDAHAGAARKSACAICRWWRCIGICTCAACVERLTAL